MNSLKFFPILCSILLPLPNFNFVPCLWCRCVPCKLFLLNAIGSLFRLTCCNAVIVVIKVLWSRNFVAKTDYQEIYSPHARETSLNKPDFMWSMLLYTSLRVGSVTNVTKLLIFSVSWFLLNKFRRSPEWQSKLVTQLFYSVFFIHTQDKRT